jgi:class 3 adenylate cyclase
VRIGIDRGTVLLFESGDGSKNVAGDPVNVASKISEDAGLAGRIRLTARAAGELDPPAAGEPFLVTVSGVQLTGISV